MTLFRGCPQTVAQLNTRSLNVIRHTDVTSSVTPLSVSEGENVLSQMYFITKTIRYVHLLDSFSSVLHNEARISTTCTQRKQNSPLPGAVPSGKLNDEIWQSYLASFFIPETGRRIQ